MRQEDVELARAALYCGDLKELQDSYREPMTVHRFMQNVQDSVSRTSFRFSMSPAAAARELC